MRRNPKFYLSAIVVWFVFLVVAFSLGTGRELLVRPLIGDYAAHIVGTLLVVIAFLGIIVFFVQRVRDRCTLRDFWLIGLLWLAMTVSFEFLFFHYVVGKPWDDLLADYNVAQGRLWVLVLLTTLLGPPVIYSLLSRRAEGANGHR